MKVSFDFDKTLSKPEVQKFAKELVSKGHDVWIVTSRCSGDSDNPIAKMNSFRLNRMNEVLFYIAKEVGIPENRIVFTCFDPKANYLKGRGFSFHLDDDEIELEDIENSGDPCVAVDVNLQSWERICRSILE